MRFYLKLRLKCVSIDVIAHVVFVNSEHLKMPANDFQFESKAHSTELGDLYSRDVHKIIPRSIF